MWTAIWTLLAFGLLLFHGDGILAFAADQLRQRRAHQLQLEQERTRQAIVARERDELIWHQLQGPDHHHTAAAPERAGMAHWPTPPPTTDQKH